MKYVFLRIFQRFFLKKQKVPATDYDVADGEKN